MGDFGHYKTEIALLRKGGAGTYERVWSKYCRNYPHRGEIHEENHDLGSIMQYHIEFVKYKISHCGIFLNYLDNSLIFLNYHRLTPKLNATSSSMTDIPKKFPPPL